MLEVCIHLFILFDMKNERREHIWQRKSDLGNSEVSISNPVLNVFKQLFLSVLHVWLLWLIFFAYLLSFNFVDRRSLFDQFGIRGLEAAIHLLSELLVPSRVNKFNFNYRYIISHSINQADKGNSKLRIPC